MIWVLLTACQPYADLVERERPWWEPERSDLLGLDLVDLEGGEPIGYWPRIVVRRDGIDVDSRAVFLSLPDKVFADPALRASAEEELLVEHTDLVPVVDGRIPDEETRGWLVTELYTVLSRLATSSKPANTSLSATRRAPSRGEIVVVPEAGLPWSTVRDVLFTAGQAQWGSYALVGRGEGGHLRSAWAPEFLDCPQLAYVRPGQGWFTLSPGERPPLAAGPDCNGDVVDALEALQQACASSWTSRHVEACLSVVPEVRGGLPVDRVMQLQDRADASPGLDPLFVAQHVHTHDEAACPPFVQTVDALTSEQLQVVCAPMHPPGHKIGAPGLLPEGYDQDVATAFPVWARWKMAKEIIGASPSGSMNSQERTWIEDAEGDP